MQSSTIKLQGRCPCIRAMNNGTARAIPCSLRPESMRRRTFVRKAFEQGDSSPGRDPSISEYVEVKVDSVRVSQGASVVYLRVLDSSQYIPVHIGEHESNALLKEINKQKQLRPLTHDVAKNMLQAIGYKVTKIRVTDIIANTFYARIHLVSVLISQSQRGLRMGRPCLGVILSRRCGING